MKTLAEIDKILQAFENRFGLTIRGAVQGSPSWHQGRLGVVTASNASKAVSGAKTDTRLNYLCGLIADVATGVIEEEVNFKQMAWGKEHEDAARSAREFATGIKFTLWALESDIMYVTQFDPRMKVRPLHTIEIEKIPKYQAQLDETIPQLILDMDAGLKEIGIEFGDHWLRIAAKEKESA
jgi:hypothetical protein